jgi:hypothetical protein
MPSSAREGMLATVIVVLQMPILSASNRPRITESQKNTKKMSPKAHSFTAYLAKA